MLADVQGCKLFDFPIDMIADIVEIFVHLRINKGINGKKKVILLLIVQGSHRWYKMESKRERIDILLKKSCYIMDFLPERVEQDNGGSFFDVEYYLLNSDKHVDLKNRFVSVILKLMCYYHVAVLWGEWIDRPKPEMIEDAVCEIMMDHSGTLNVLFVEQDVLLVFDWDCLNLSVYNPAEDIQSVMKKIAFSEGLFWREAAN